MAPKRKSKKSQMQTGSERQAMTNQPTSCNVSLLMQGSGLVCGPSPQPSAQGNQCRTKSTWNFSEASVQKTYDAQQKNLLGSCKELKKQEESDGNKDAHSIREDETTISSGYDAKSLKKRNIKGDSSISKKGDPTTKIEMQREEPATSDALETMHQFGAQEAESNGVLTATTIGGETFEEAMDPGDECGLKRQADNSDAEAGDSGEPMEEEEPKKKKTRGRVKIDMKYIDNKMRRYTTFSKRKTGIMKKAYELSTLTGTQAMLLVASETGHVYTFATKKLQPMITSESGKALIQTCLNSPDLPVSHIPNPDQRMSQTGYEETDLAYTPVKENQAEKMQQQGGIFTTQQIAASQGLAVGAISGRNGPITGITALPATSHSFPITTYVPPSNVQQQGGNKSASGPSSYSVQATPGGAFTTIFAPGTSVQLGQTLTQGQQQGSTVQVLPQPLQIQRAHQSHMQTVQVNAVNPTIPSNTITMQMGQKANHTEEHNVNQALGSQGNNLQSVGSVVVPIATNQDGTVVYSVYASPSSGLVTVSHLSDSSTDQSSGHAHHLSGEANDIGQQSLPGSLSLATVQVHQDVNRGAQTYTT